MGRQGRAEGGGAGELIGLNISEQEVAPSDTQIDKCWKTREDTEELKQRRNTMPSIRCPSYRSMV